MPEYDKFRILDKGCNSQCFTDGQKVIKLTSAGAIQDEAQKKYQQMVSEYELLKRYLGEYAHDTSLSLQRDSVQWVVRIEQDYVEGTPLRMSLHSKNPAITDFFYRSLHLYKETGVLPDLLPDIMPDPTGGIYINGKFTYRSQHNVLLVGDSPLLIDTTLNKSLRGRFLAPPLRALMAFQIRRLLPK